jgi:GH35 family endo-1,4-beta-xylanase
MIAMLLSFVFAIAPVTSDAEALAAADAYIAQHRRGEVTIELPDISPGTIVHVKMTRLAFDLGGNASGATNVLMATDPPPESDAAKFQAFVAKHFNTLVPSNAGKWANNEAERGKVTLDYVDAILAFAKAHGMHVRMHNLIWQNQQPQWVNDLLKKAKAGDAAAKAELRRAISDRIRYYVRDRAKDFHQIDVLNESVHVPMYVDVFGLDGVAGIYREVAEAIDAAGSKSLTFENEYNVLQYSQSKDKSADPLANWYRERVEQLNRAGARVGGIGVQYYADPRKTIREPHSAARISNALQNLTATGLPVVLTEFGIKNAADDAEKIRVLDETLRLCFGTENCEGFLFFGFWEKAMWNQAPDAVIVDKEFNLTPLGHAFVAMLARWRTELDTTVSSDHTITFTAYYGDYELLPPGGVVRRVSISRDQSRYSLSN